MIRLGVALLAVGGIIVALPDSDDRLFSISRTHGPSTVDAAGTVVLVAGWALLVRVMWQARDAVRRARGFALGVGTLVVGAVVLVVAVLRDLGLWWVAGAALVAMVQALALGVAAAAPKSQ